MKEAKVRESLRKKNLWSLIHLFNLRQCCPGSQSPIIKNYRYPKRERTALICSRKKATPSCPVKMNIFLHVSSTSFGLPELPNRIPFKQIQPEWQRVFNICFNAVTRQLCHKFTRLELDNRKRFCFIDFQNASDRFFANGNTVPDSF